MSTEMSTREQTVVFGVLAVKLGKVSPEAWEEAAMTTLANAPSDAVTIDVARQLVAQGTISPHDAETIQGMAAQAIRAHGGDALKAINALASEAEVVHTVASSLFEDPHAAATLVQQAGFDPNAKTIAIQAKKFDDQTLATGTADAKTLATDPSFADTVASDPGGVRSHAETIMSGRREPGAAPTVLGTGGPGGQRARSSSDSLPAVQEHFGRYDMVKELGAGGMGKLLIVHDTHLGRDVALKTLLPERLPGGTRTRTGAPTMEILTVPIIARFLQEARIAGQLEHSAIVPAYELGYRPDGSIYYTMRLVRGKSMQDALKECKGLDERLKLLPNFLDVCNAVAYAHTRSVIHRDLKPLNVMIGEFGETLLIDWGIAKIKGVQDIHAQDVVDRAKSLRIGDAEATAKTTYGQAMGSPYFMPPEQAAGKIDEVDERADIYSLGAILYVFLTGHPPYKEMKVMEFLDKVQSFDPRPIREQQPDAPAELIAICERAMARKREDRYQSALDLRDEVRKYIDGGLVGAYKYSMKELVLRWIKRHKAILSTAAAGLVAFLVLAVYSYIAVTIQRDEAVTQRNRAEENEKIASRERDNAETELYFANTSLAQQSIKAGQMAAARAQLAGAPAKDRNWEWGHFQRLCNLDRMTLEIGGQYVALGPNGTIITGNDRGTISVVDGETGESKARLIEKAGYGYAFATSADGKRAAMNGPTGVRVWDIASGQEIFTKPHELPEGKAFPFGVTLTADGGRVAANQPDEIGRVWDVASGSLLLEAPAALGGVYLDAKGGTAAAAYLDRENAAFMAKFFSLADKGEIKAFSFEVDNSIKEIVFSPDGGHVALSTDQALILFETAGWTQPMGAPIAGPFGKPDTTVFSADGKYLAAATKDGAVFRIKLGSTPGQYEGFYTSAPHSGDVRSIAIAADAGLLVTGSGDRSIHVYHLDTLELISRYPGHDGAVFDVAVDSTGARMASTSEDSYTKVWDLASDLNRYFHPLGDRPVAFAQDQGLLAIGIEKVVVIAEAATGKALRVIDAPGAKMLAWDPAGTRLAIYQGGGSGAGKITVRDTAADDQPVQEMMMVGTVTRLAIAGDGSALVTDGDEGLQVVDLASGTALPVEGAVNWALAPRGNALAVGTGARVSVYTLPGLAEAGGLDVAGAPGLLWGPDGARLYIATQKMEGGYAVGETLRWDLATKAALPPLTGHGQVVTAVADNAQWIATGSGGKDNLILWDAATGEKKGALEGHAGSVVCLGFSPDGSRLASGGIDGTFKLWDTTDGGLIATVQDTGLSATGTVFDTVRWQVAFTPDGNTLATISNPPLPPVALPSFPWDEAKYGGDAAAPLQQRIEQWKRAQAR